MKYNIEITGTQEILNKITQYSVSLDMLPEYVANDISKANTICQINMPTGATGELYNSLKNDFTIEEDEISVDFYVDSEHAKYVEYGTGVFGASSPHPEAKQNGWQYNVPSKSKDFTGGWMWKDDKVTHQFIYTHGMHSRPFMYRTAQWLNEKLVKTILGVFKR